MGCWNGTCGITQMPITSGQKVKAYILVPHHYDDVRNSGTTVRTFSFDEIEKFRGSGICYPTDAWSPLSIPISAEYNDYGGLQNIKMNQNVKNIFEWISKETNKKFKDAEDMIGIISQGETPFALMMVHESIYNAAIDAVEESRHPEYDGDRLLINVMIDFEAAREYLQTEGAKDSLMDGLKTLGIKSAAPPDPLISLRMAFMGASWPKREGAHSSAVESYSHHRREGAMYDDFSREYFSKMMKSESTPIEDLVNHFQFCCFMSGARRTWIAQSGCGSQVTEYKMHRLIAEATLKHLEEVKAEHSEDVDLTISEEAEYFNKQY